MKTLPKVILGFGLAGGLFSIINSSLDISKKTLVLYLNPNVGEPEFARAAEYAVRTLPKTTVKSIASIADIQQALRIDTKFKRLILMGHGTSRSFFKPGSFGLSTIYPTSNRYLNVEDFAQNTSRILSRNAVISLAGCRSGSNIDEPDWSEISYRPGGESSLAALLRDAYAKYGASGEVRSKSVTGHTLANPHGRVFRIKRSLLGKPGQPVYNRTEQGAIAWTLGM